MEYKKIDYETVLVDFESLDSTLAKFGHDGFQLSAMCWIGDLKKYQLVFYRK